MAKGHRLRVKIGTDTNGKPIVKQISAKNEIDLADKVVWAIINSGRIHEFLPELTLPAPEEKPAEKPDEKPAEKHNFKEYARHWRATYKQGKEQNTQVFITAKLSVLFRTFGDMDVEDITSSDVQNFLNDRGARCKKATVKADWAMLKEILDSAVEDGIIEKNPAKNRRLHNPAEEGSGTKALTREQLMSIQQAIPALEDDRERNLIALLAYTSMRREEVLGLRWENVDFKNRMIYIREALVFATRVAAIKKTKTKSSERSFPMGEALYEILMQSRNKGGYVVPGKKFGPISEYDYGQLWRSLKKHIELYGMTAINFRTTFATMAVASGVDIRTTQSLMGHSTPDMTLKVYTRQEETRLPVAVEKMGDFLQTNTAASS